jgi:sterol 3beta-glucosyltransferase
MFGLFAYPFLGMYRSMSTSSLSRTQQRIMLTRQVYGSYMARQRENFMREAGEAGDDGSVNHVLEEFEKKKKDTA